MRSARRCLTWSLARCRPRLGLGCINLGLGLGHVNLRLAGGRPQPRHHARVRIDCLVQRVRACHVLTYNRGVQQGCVVRR